MKRIFAVVYCLVLLVQMPHVSTVYAALEHRGWYQWLGWPLSLAFEMSILVFTFRIVVERSTRRTTRAGLGFFLVASCVANATYYGLAPGVFAWLMPVFATVALPLSLALFAGEFGAEVRREERRARRLEGLPEARNVTEMATERDQGKAAPLPEQPARRITFAEFAAAHPVSLLSSAEVAALAGISERQARNWRNKARNGGNHDHVIAL